MPDKSRSVKCARDAMAYPPECFSLPTDGRKAKHVCRQRRELFIQYALYADGDGTRAWPGEKRICKEMGLSRRTAERLVADLKELGCVVEAVGPDGKIKLHGPRGTTERLVVPDALPAPGSTAWFEVPTGKIRLEYMPEFSCTFDDKGSPVWEAVAPNSRVVADAVAPNSTPVAPHSAAVAPHTKAVAPKPADFGGQPPRFTATRPAPPPPPPPQAPAGEGVVVSNPSGKATPKADKIVAWFIKKGQPMPATKKVREAIEAMLANVPDVIGKEAIERWYEDRDFKGLHLPAQAMLAELPDYIRVVTGEQ